MTQREFPILMGVEREQLIALGVPRSVPWAFAELARVQAAENHDQTLETLASRGGLSVAEFVWALEGKRWGSPGTDLTMAPVFLRRFAEWTEEFGRVAELERSLAAAEAAYALVCEAALPGMPRYGAEAMAVSIRLEQRVAERNATARGREQGMLQAWAAAEALLEECARIPLDHEPHRASTIGSLLEAFAEARHDLGEVVARLAPHREVKDG